MNPVAFVDTETTGLDPDRHEVWEVGLIVGDTAYLWHLPVDLGRADPFALRIGRFHERYCQDQPTTALRVFSEEFAELTRGCHLAGAVVSFDEERLRRLLRANGACPEWHYHLIDVEALAVGWVHGKYGTSDEAERQALALPWDSEALSRCVGVEPEEFDRHTALGDAHWARAIYKAVTACQDE